MKTKEVVIEGRKFVVRELLAIEYDDIDFNDKKSSIKKQVTMCANITDEEYSKLTFKERLLIMDAMNDLNGVKDFLIPAK